MRTNCGTFALPTRNSILVVDDDPSMRASIMRLLKVHGFSAMLFESATDILGYGNFETAFGMIIDINLNGECGIGVCQSLAERGVALPVIFITGNDSAAIRAAAMKEASCIAYLTKPFPAPSLMGFVERARAAAL